MVSSLPNRSHGTSPRMGGATFSLSHRLSRLSWNIVWMGLGFWTPTPLHRWRRFLVRVFGGNIATTARIYGGVRIWHPLNLTMADYSCLATGVDCYCMDKITLGKHATVSQRAFLCAGTHDISDLDFKLVSAPISIGADAWVAAEAFVGPGVTVAEGAVLGARGVAVRDLAAWTVYVGNPARAVQQRTMSNRLAP